MLPYRKAGPEIAVIAYRVANPSPVFAVLGRGGGIVEIAVAAAIYRDYIGIIGIAVVIVVVAAAMAAAATAAAPSTGTADHFPRSPSQIPEHPRTQKHPGRYNHPSSIFSRNNPTIADEITVRSGDPRFIPPPSHKLQKIKTTRYHAILPALPLKVPS